VAHLINGEEDDLAHPGVAAALAVLAGIAAADAEVLVEGAQVVLRS